MAIVGSGTLQCRTVLLVIASIVCKLVVVLYLLALEGIHQVESSRIFRLTPDDGNSSSGVNSTPSVDKLASWLENPPVPPLINQIYVKS
ncbi:hypothetical protein NOF04DRAFT_1325470 [Fusarium oxysporum II5]|nr:hypothetical protein NOF04DRAFT_1325470 [Fusarium oxysporum II5]